MTRLDNIASRQKSTRILTAVFGLFLGLATVVAADSVGQVASSSQVAHR